MLAKINGTLQDLHFVFWSIKMPSFLICTPKAENLLTTNIYGFRVEIVMQGNQTGSFLSADYMNGAILSFMLLNWNLSTNWLFRIQCTQWTNRYYLHCFFPFSRLQVGISVHISSTFRPPSLCCKVVTHVGSRGCSMCPRSSETCMR